METEILENGLFAWLPGWAGALLAAAFAVLWAALHTRAESDGGRGAGLRRMLLGTLAGAAALTGAFHFLGGFVTLATVWPLWTIALAGAAAVEAVLRLYAMERGIVTPRARTALGILRVALVLLAALMLAQPVRVFEWSETVRRYVAVLLDESASMRVADLNMTPSEKMRLAEALAVPGARRDYRLEEIARALDDARGGLAAQADWLAALHGVPPEEREEQLERRRRVLHAMFGESLRVIEEQAGILAEFALEADAYTKELTDRATACKTALEREARDPLAGLAEQTAPESMPVRWLRRLFPRPSGPASAPEGASEAPPEANATAETAPPEIALGERYEEILRDVRRIAAALAELTPEIRELAPEVDAGAYAMLDADARVRVDALAERTRLGIAEDLLLGRPLREDGGAHTADDSLFERLSAAYGVKVYAFAAEPVELDAVKWAAEYADALERDRAAAETGDAFTETVPDGTDGDPDATDGGIAQWNEMRAAKESLLTPGLMRTDLTAALAGTLVDIAAEQFGGVILLTDGRHNSGTPPEALAGRMAVMNVPIFPVVFGGGTNPPADTAIAAVEHPDMVYKGDKVFFNVALKLDGVTNETVEVVLLHDEKVVDSATVEVDDPVAMRARVDLGHEPESRGLQQYRIEIRHDAREAVQTNRTRTVGVNVAQDRTQLLIVDGRPTWEFRYLKNLFSGRDRTVQLQYVLMEPDLIADMPARATVPAVAGGPLDVVEATALPDGEEEWFKFDAVIIGDVPPDAFTEEDYRSLFNFVNRRGGTLIAIAGPRHMPHAFADTPLAELLPVHAPALDRALTVGPEPFFRVALTAEGRASPIMRLKVDPDENTEEWNELPEVFWRHGMATAKEGATVLAYARPPDLPDFMTRRTLDEEGFRRRIEYERRQALVSHHGFGRGNAMFLGFNQTWRLRYKVGDLLHHRFWGQILRWATADKLPFGTPLARIGTENPTYAPDRPVRVRARLNTADREPVVCGDLDAVVFAGEIPLMRKRMTYVPDSPGVYEADLGVLSNGVYRIELESEEAARKIDPEDIAQAVAGFVVTPAVQSELVELSADRGLPSRLAGMTGGLAVTPAEIARIEAALGPPETRLSRRRQHDLWNSWPLLVIMVAVMAAEWIVRKRERLP